MSKTITLTTSELEIIQDAIDIILVKLSRPAPKG